METRTRSTIYQKRPLFRCIVGRDGSWVGDLAETESETSGKQRTLVQHFERWFRPLAEIVCFSSVRLGEPSIPSQIETSLSKSMEHSGGFGRRTAR